MSITVTPIPTLIEFATPSVTIGATAAAGDALTAIRSNSTIAGVALITSVNDAIARYNGTGGQLQGYTSGAPTIGDTGVITASAQPAFSYVLSAGRNDVTGGGTTYTLGIGTALTQVFDQSNEVTTAGVFTAGTAGIYLLGCSITFNAASAVAAMDNYMLSIVTTTKTLSSYGDLTANEADTGSLGVGQIRMTDLFQMAATNTAKVQLTVYDSSDTLDLEAANTIFWGVKVA